MKQYLVAIGVNVEFMAEDNDVKFMDCQIIKAENPHEACLCYNFLNGYALSNENSCLPTVCLGRYNPKAKKAEVSVKYFIRN